MLRGIWPGELSSSLWKKGVCSLLIAGGLWLYGLVIDLHMEL